MRLLYVTEEVPNRDPVHGNGSSMIPYEVLRHLPDDVETTLLTFRSQVDVPAEIRERCAEVVLVQPRRRVGAALLSLVSRLSIGAAGRMTVTARRRLREASADADVTLLHGPHVAPLAPVVQGPLVLQVVDPWSLRLRMEVMLAHGARAVYRAGKARQALAVERGFPRRARLLTVGQRDATTWAEEIGRPVTSIGNGVDRVALQVPLPSVPTVSFVGSLSYRPNVESARVLVREIAPRVWERVPDMRVVIAGRQPDAEVLALASDRVEIRANVPSVSEVFLSSSVAVFADRHGLGVRNSVKEALAAGVPVIASGAAAREQDAHPLLTVTADEDELVERVVAALLAPRRPAPVPAEAGLRDWTQVAGDYLVECRAALEAQDETVAVLDGTVLDHGV